MSTIETNRSTPAGGGVGYVGAQLAAWFASWRETRVTRNQLSRLTDRELDDIGLCRGDIERVARGI